MRKYNLILGLMLVLALAACKPAPEPGTPVTHAEACTAENNDKRVTLTGYPRIDGLVMVSDDMGVDLYEKPGGEGTSVTVYILVGSGANHVENIPDDFTDADLKIHTKDNTVVSTDSKISVTGKVLYTPESGGTAATCLLMYVDLIEKAE